MARNYYVVLGVPPDASREEIRDAYRRLVKMIHPDVSGVDSAERFREVQEAWETLGDEQRRRNYDLALKRAQRPPLRSVATAAARRYSVGTGARSPLAADIDELGETYLSAAGGEEIHFGLRMTAAEAATGGEMPLRIPLRVRCPECAGTGLSFLFLCLACGGSGYRSSWRTFTFKVPAGLKHHTTLQVPLAPIGLPHARLILHVEIDPLP